MVTHNIPKVGDKIKVNKIKINGYTFQTNVEGIVEEIQLSAPSKTTWISGTWGDFRIDAHNDSFEIIG